MVFTPQEEAVALSQIITFVLSSDETGEVSKAFQKARIHFAAQGNRDVSKVSHKARIHFPAEANTQGLDEIFDALALRHIAMNLCDQDEDGDIFAAFDHEHIHTPSDLIELAEDDIETLEFVNEENVISRLRTGPRNTLRSVKRFCTLITLSQMQTSMTRIG